MKTLQRRVRHSLALAAGVVGCTAASVLPARAAVVAGIGMNFTGTSFGTNSTNSPFVPPDCDGAIGPTNFVELVNGRFSVYDKFTARLVETMTDSNFWVQAGVSIPTNWDISDPRMIYDPSAQRWFACQIDFDALGVNIARTNHFLLAVSAT